MAPRVLELHASEASFLYDRRRAAADAPNYGLAELAFLDERVDAHLDGLRIAGKQGVRAARAQAGENEPGGLFTLAAQALDARAPEAFADALDRAEKSASPDEVLAALGWIDGARGDWAVRALLHEGCPPALKRFGVLARAAHGQSVGEPALADLLAIPDEPLRAAAFEAAWTTGEVVAPSVASGALASADPRVRVHAHVALARSGAASLVGLWDALAAAPPPARGADAIALAVRLDPAGAGLALDRLSLDPARAREAILLAAALGDRARVPWLLERMQDEAAARLAGEAFDRLTGVAITGALADGGRARKEEDPEGPLDPDRALAWPHPTAVASAWNEVVRSLPRAGRLLLGKPVSTTWCTEVLGAATQPLRVAAALELAALTPREPVFDARAPGFRQASRA